MNLRIVKNNPDFFPQFKRFNEQWIDHFFNLEQVDIDTLNSADKIIEDGGFIFTLLLDNKPIGVTALLKIEPEVFELTKMAIDIDYRGKGYSNYLISDALKTAQESKAKKVIIYTNSKLKPAVGLYLKHGFNVINNIDTSKYERCDLTLEKFFRD